MPYIEYISTPYGPMETVMPFAEEDRCEVCGADLELYMQDGEYCYDYLTALDGERCCSEKCVRAADGVPEEEEEEE